MIVTVWSSWGTSTVCVTLPPPARSDPVSAAMTQEPAWSNVTVWPAMLHASWVVAGSIENCTFPEPPEVVTS